MGRDEIRFGVGKVVARALVGGVAWVALLAPAFADETPTPPAVPAAPAVQAPENSIPGVPVIPDAKPADAPPTGPSATGVPAVAPATGPIAPPPLTRAETRATLPNYAPVPEYVPCEPCRSSRRWTVRIEGGVTGVSPLKDGLGEGVPSDTDELSWDRLSYDASLAARLGLGVNLDACNSLEAGFAWYGSWQADGARETGAFGFAPPTDGVSPPLTVSMDAEAEAYGARAVWWHTVHSNGSFTAQLGAGARWIHFHETGDATDWQPVTGPAPALHGEATDDLVAALVGARIFVRPTACWTFGAEVEAFGGWMHRAVDVRDTAVLSAGSHSSSIDQDDFSWGFELELSTLHTLTERIALRGSVGMLYLADVNRVDTVFDFGQAATGVVQARDEGREAMIPFAYLGLEFSF